MFLFLYMFWSLNFTLPTSSSSSSSLIFLSCKCAIQQHTFNIKKNEASEWERKLEDQNVKPFSIKLLYGRCFYENWKELLVFYTGRRLVMVVVLVVVDVVQIFYHVLLDSALKRDSFIHFCLHILLMLTSFQLQSIILFMHIFNIFLLHLTIL